MAARPGAKRVVKGGAIMASPDPKVAQAPACTQSVAMPHTDSSREGAPLYQDHAGCYM